MNRKHPSYRYTTKVLSGKVSAPKYVVQQCAEFKTVADGFDPVYCIDEKKVGKIDGLLRNMRLAKGLKAGRSLYEAAVGYQWLFWISVLCTVYREESERRRYETAILEIARKNFKTATIAVLFLLLMLLEPKFSKFFSVAPDGALSREVKSAIEEIIASSPALSSPDDPEQIFKIRRDDIFCKLNKNDYVPLNYSNSRLDGRLPSAFVVDEAGALPNSYAIEAMRSGQLTVLNKLGCIISTKYPTAHNPFEGEVDYAKKVLDGVIEDDRIFALLYEPDETAEWATDDRILEQANPAALEIPEIMEDIRQKRARAIEVESARENFLTKHCNIIYQGVGTETYIPVTEVQKCCVEKIDWNGKEVYLGVDLALTTDNCAVAMAALDGDTVFADVVAFIPEDRVEEKSKLEKIDYREFIRAAKCVACGDRTVDYSIIERFVLELEERYRVKVMGIAYDRYNALSSAQKWEEAGYNTVVVRQHSDTLHPPTKLLEELILDGRFRYEKNKLLEINFENARCTFDTNLNRYVNKKRSAGKVDMVVALINAVYLLQQNEIFGAPNWVVQVI